MDTDDGLSSVRGDLESAARLVCVRYGGVCVNDVPIGPLVRSPAARVGLLTRLSSALYTTWFARARPGSQTSPAAERPSVIAAVRAAHAATERFEAGWVVRVVGGGGRVIATRTGDDLPLRAIDYVNLTRPGAPARAGDSLAVTMRRDSVDETGGWWVTWRSGPASTAAPSLVRVYWNCGADAAPMLVSEITRTFEDRRLDYSLKCPTDAALFNRVDAVVLYLAPSVWTLAKADLRAVYTTIAARLRPGVPPFTRPLGAGVSAAEDPMDGRSYGQRCADAVADGALCALEAGRADTAGMLAGMEEALPRHGITLARPYARSGNGSDPIGMW